MKDWVHRALLLLSESLKAPPSEINELDWKIDLSSDKQRLAEHLSAFANYPGGGYLVYGVTRLGSSVGVTQEQIDQIVNHISNLGREAVQEPIVIDHAVENFESVRLLFVHICEAVVKPVHIRGKSTDASFIRSGSTTRKASKQEIGSMMLNSRSIRWEELRATVLLKENEIVPKLNTGSVLTLAERPSPVTPTEMLDWLCGEKFVAREASGGGYITNLGAIAAARKLSDYSDLARKAVRVVVYDGLNKGKAKSEREGAMGYAVGFQGLLKFVLTVIPRSEVIEEGLRKNKPAFPETALREIIANALIHQDFTISGVGPLIEIFDDRIEVSNPGELLPSKQIDRLIGTQPESRNELLAKTFRRYKICEERGSGLVKAGLQVELYGLPPIEFTAGANHFKVTLFSQRSFAAMTPAERLRACYQHAVLKHLSSSAMTNKSLRERLKMPEKQRSMVSVIIAEALEKNLIKTADPENKSRKYSEYIPFWA